MPLLKLVLQRHGQTDHNVGLRLTGWGDPGLDDTGLAQARATAEGLLQDYIFDAVYTSPLKRARQTAEPVLAKTGLTPKLNEDLKELNFGEVEGMTIPEVKTLHPELFNTWRSLDEPAFSWPGGETRMVFHSRVDRAIWDIILAEAGQSATVLIVAHGGSLAGFISELQVGEPYAWRKFLLDNCEHYVVQVEFDNTPVTRENCTLQVIHTGKLVPLNPGE